MSRVTVIIPSYNEAERMTDTLRHWCMQTRSPDQLVVVDDGSTDGTPDVLRMFPQVDVIRQSNQGCVAAVRAGFDATTSEYVYFGAMDDWPEPEFIEQSMAMLEANPQAALCTADVFHHAGDEVHEWRQQLCHAPTYFRPLELARYLAGRYLFGASTVSRRDMVMESGLFDAALRWHTDWFANLVMAFRAGACVVPNMLVHCTYRPESYSNHGRADWQQQQHVIARVFELLSTPEFMDVAPAFAMGRAMRHFGNDAIRLLMERPPLRPVSNFELLLLP